MVKSNPVYRREMTVRARSFRMPFIILTFNGILAAAALLNMYSAVAQVRISASIQYTSFLQLYAFVAILEFLLLMFIMPALTTGSISGERERRTLDLLFTTKMTPGDIVMGKLFSASSLMRRSTFSNVCTYGLLLLSVAGTYMVNLFLYNMSQMQIDNMVFRLGESRPAANSGAAVYLLLINPMVTFAEILGNQVTGGAEWFSVGRFLEGSPAGFIASHWVLVSLLVQSVLAVCFVRGAIYFLNPERNEKK